MPIFDQMPRLRRPSLILALLVGLTAACDVVENDEPGGPVVVRQTNQALCAAACVAGTEDSLELGAWYGMMEEPRAAPGVLLQLEALSDAVELGATELRTGSDGTVRTSIRFLEPAARAEVRVSTPEEAGAVFVVSTEEGAVIPFTIYPELPRMTISPDSVVLEEGCTAPVSWRLTAGGDVLPLGDHHAGILDDGIATLNPGTPASVTGLRTGRTGFYAWVEDGVVRMDDLMPVVVTPFRATALDFWYGWLFLGQTFPVSARLEGACKSMQVGSELAVTAHTPDVLSYDPETHTLTVSGLGQGSITLMHGDLSHTAEFMTLDYRVAPQDTSVAEGESFEYRPQFAHGDSVYQEGGPSFDHLMEYASSDTSVVTVARRNGWYGVLLARKEGTATITAQYVDRHGHQRGPSRQATVTVTAD